MNRTFGSRHRRMPVELSARRGEVHLFDNRTSSRSTAMYSMHEALARDRMRELQRRSRSAELARGVAAERRWHRVALYAQAAHARRARQVGQLAGR